MAPPLIALSHTEQCVGQTVKFQLVGEATSRHRPGAVKMAKLITLDDKERWNFAPASKYVNMYDVRSPSPEPAGNASQKY
jgi:hypothetical protein